MITEAMTPIFTPRATRSASGLPPTPRALTPRSETLDCSRAAAQFSLRAGVLIDQKVIEHYREHDLALGRNVVGTVLSVLALQSADGREVLGDGLITCELVRRDDAHPVEVELLFCRRRQSGREYLVVSLLRERQVRE